MEEPTACLCSTPRKHRPAIIGVRLETEALQTELDETYEALRGNIRALNVKLNLLLVMQMVMLPAVLALLWKAFFAAPQ